MWSEQAKRYGALISSEDWDSRYLRDRGLIRNIVELVGDCSDKTVLDAGTGTGWLFKHIRPAVAHACDLVEPEKVDHSVKFRREDVNDLSYEDAEFDLVVASLLVIFCEDLRKVLGEFHRVTKEDGQLLLSLVHPYFYRTGDVLSDGSFNITEDLSYEREASLKIAEMVGPFVYYYRPFPVYINALTYTGWCIEEVRDWFIDVEEYGDLRRRGVKSLVERSGRIPMYCFIKAKRRVIR